jgi:hypothetical protein
MPSGTPGGAPLNLVPIEKGERRGHRGRVAGVQNMYTRAMKTALYLAAEESKHSDGSLKGYLLHLADEKPELFAPMLMRLIPVQAKIEHHGPPPKRLDPSMSIDEMVSNFVMKIKDTSYRPEPRLIENERDEE